MTALPNGLLQSYNTALTKLSPLQAMAEARSNEGVSNVYSLRSAVSSGSTAAQSQMTIFAAGFKDMKTYAMASCASEDLDVDNVIGGTCSLLKACANGKILNDLISRVDQLAQALITGTVEAVNALISQLYSDAENALSLVTTISEFTRWLSEHFRYQMDSFAKFLMLAGNNLNGVVNALTDCFAAASIYDPESATMFNVASALSADLASGTLPVKDAQAALRSRLRTENNFSGKITSNINDMSSSFGRDALRGSVETYKQAKNTPVEKPTPPSEYIDPISTYRFDEDNWDNQIAEWAWQDNNTVQIDPITSLRKEGILVYNAISNAQWQGTLVVNLQSLSTGRKAAGLVLGRNANGQRVGVVKRGTTGLGLFTFEQDSLVVPTNYTPIEDHTSGLSFDAWIDITGVQLRLMADETHFTITAQEFGTTDPVDLLQVVRADLAMIEIGLITLDEEMKFHFQLREDA